MTKLETIALDEFEVSFTMRAGSQARQWTLQIPAVDEERAKTAAYGIAYGINEGSAHVWKITDEVTAVRVSAEERSDDPSKSSDLGEVS